MERPTSSQTNPARRLSDTERELMAESLATSRRRDASVILRQLLDDKNYNVRISAVRSLMFRKDKRALPKVAALIHDREELVRCEVIEYVAQSGGLRGFRLLTSTLHDPSPLVRGTAAVFLGESYGARGIPFLKKRLCIEKSGIVKVSLFEGLCSAGEVEYIEFIVKSLRSRSYQVRCRAANALGRLVSNSNRSMVIHALMSALTVETTVAAKSSIADALKKTVRGRQS